MAKVNCEVIEDLLPIYVENMVSDSSGRLVEGHLKECKACREKEKVMRSMLHVQGQEELSVIQNTTCIEEIQDTRKKIGTKKTTGTNEAIESTRAGALKKIQAKLFQKEMTVGIVSVLITLVITVFCVIHLNAQITIPYEEVAHRIAVYTTEAGALEFAIDVSDCSVKIEQSKEDEMGNVVYIYCYTTKWMQLMGKIAGKYQPENRTENIERLVYTLENPNEQINRRIDRIYYYPAVDGEAVCIYNKPDLSETFLKSGHMVLPRLTLNYYKLFAVACSVCGVVCCILLRKKEKLFAAALKITVFPIVYYISSLIVLSGRNDIYNAAYYFSGIILMTILIAIIGIWIISYCFYRRKRHNFGTNFYTE